MIYADASFIDVAALDNATRQLVDALALLNAITLHNDARDHQRLSIAIADVMGAQINLESLRRCVRAA